MKFDVIDPSFTQDEVNLASRILAKIMVELGILENNEHVGSGLGGNNHQLLVFMTMKHHLVSSDKDIVIMYNTVYWSIEFLISNKIRSIRSIIDNAFKLVFDENKLVALALHTVANNPTLVLPVVENTLPEIVIFYYNEFLSGRALDLSNLSYSNQFMISLLLCAKLSYFLDNAIVAGNYIKVAGQSLETVEPEIFLLVVRKAIKLDRLIKYNLDENIYWKHTLIKVCRILDAL